ncbi:arylesterase [Hymenobacter coccineus]|uniref:Arylesterase n=1 Tax=Hymenobacter coccineus TaxID=1908235 RepID=A0A1G1SRA0_9BACT|nr:arylesterase [Hymenobacter coccineus]OGX81153.1 arylesterase [Hymenobacter coccineus]
MKNILFFGDSLTAGYGLPAAASFPALVQQKIDAAQLPYKVLNYGVSGDTTAGGRARLAAALARQPADVFVLALGANDGIRSVPIPDTSANLQAILEAVREALPAAQLVVAGLEFPFNVSPLGNHRLVRYAGEFKAVFRPLAQQFGAAFVPFLLEGVLGHRDLNLADGVHPNAAGQQILADNVWAVLGPLLAQRAPSAG